MPSPPVSDSQQAGPSTQPPCDFKRITDATKDLCNSLRQQEASQRQQYHTVSVFYNLLAILQVMVGATITALGPFGGSHLIAITVLGAVNTVIAGFIALLKGRGLPQRPRKNMYELQRVREFITNEMENLEPGNAAAAKSLLKEAFRLYTLAEETIERNQPDTYVQGVAPVSSREPRPPDRRQNDEEMGRPQA
ncbi:hypothetical protein BDV28DRAFT_159521 [Aspergillus coremiiformis]|uniref:SMODS and SLOG-associating 2TM effector domain-containing protein n=1 Tax=Aspergillus coremiiformis TaxID=138285 RepID=A0A5N6Z1G5_9EURO|nr:hypothetical protein BDV28DRAFT_159521 [Aspergillus coremiiformis]